MKTKLYITAIGENTRQVLAKKSSFSGMHFAKYQLVSIDETTNQTKTQLYVGDVITVLKTVFLQTGLKELVLGNFKLTISTGAKRLESTAVVPADILAVTIDAEVHGDGLNALARLATSTHVAVAQVIGKRGDAEIDYGTILVPAGDNSTDSAQMVSWKKLQPAIKAGKVAVHNIAYDEEHGTIVRTNISSLDKVYLVVKATQKTAAEKKADKERRDPRKDHTQKVKLLNSLMQAKSPLVYSLTKDYDLDTLQYIMKIHTQNEPVDYMLNPAYTVEQLRALHKAYLAGIDVALIADPKISAKTMEGVVTKFEYGLWKVIDVDNLRKTVES